MAQGIFSLLLVQGLVCKILSIYAQPSIQQYMQLAGLPQSGHTFAVPTPPTSSIAATKPPKPAAGLTSLSALPLPELISRLQQLPTIQQAVALPKQFANQARPTTGLNSLSALGLPNMVPCQKHTEVNTASSSIDYNLLNNLAIALQLLIVSNILNAPPPVDSFTAKSKEIEPCSDPDPQYTQASMPNYNFLGHSSFSEPNLGSAYTPTRNSMFLMSPYEVLGSTSPYSDTILNQYAPSNPRQDFQSPYSIMTDTDMFSMSDLF